MILLTGSGSVIFRVPAAGGTRVPVTKLRPETGDRIHISPFFLPDGRHFLYSSGTGGAIASSVYVGSLDSDNATRLLDGSGAKYANGYVVFLRGSTLMAQRFDPRSPGALRRSGSDRAGRSDQRDHGHRGVFRVAERGAGVPERIVGRDAA